MNRKYITTGFIASAMLIGSTAIFAAEGSPNTSLEAGTPVTAAPPEAPATAAPAPTQAPAASTEAPVAKTNSINKPLAKVTCEEFLALDEVIQPKYFIAAEAHAKGGKPKNVVIDVVATESLVPVLIEECSKAPKESFLSKLKSKLKR